MVTPTNVTFELEVSELILGILNILYATSSRLVSTNPLVDFSWCVELGVTIPDTTRNTIQDQLLLVICSY